MTDTLDQRIEIDVVSDVVCPWCFIGKRRLDRALALIPDIDVEVSWRPFQLDPTIPEGGIDRVAYMERKFGSIDRVRAISERIAAEGAGDGIAFRFDLIRRSPNTLDAHRLIRWAGSTGNQTEVVEALFRRYFIDGQDVGDPAVLRDAAAEAGLNPDVVARLLTTDADVEAVQTEVAAASRMGVTGVPCFILGQAFAVPGAQDAETLARYIARIAQRRASAVTPAS